MMKVKIKSYEEIIEWLYANGFILVNHDFFVSYDSSPQTEFEVSYLKDLSGKKLDTLRKITTSNMAIKTWYLLSNGRNLMPENFCEIVLLTCLDKILEE